MKFTDFLDTCQNILATVGKANFIKLPLQLHDVDSSSQFAQVLHPAESINIINGKININSGRNSTTLTTIISNIKDAVDKIGGDPEITVNNDSKYILGYNNLAKTVIASYNLPMEDDIEESIIDQPQEDLALSIWKNTENGYILTENAEQIISKIIDWAINQYGLPKDVGIHIIGSIASNQYSDDSDIDLHFYKDGFDLNGQTSEDFNINFRKEFSEFIKNNPELAKIDKYPIEVYFQENKFQDMMSAGCYDVKTKTWVVGPEIKDTIFDPYSEYYNDATEYIDNIINEIRQSILSVYEKSIVFINSKDLDFKKEIGKKFLIDIKNTADLFKKIKGMRKVISMPKSEEDAKQMRLDRRWYVADSAFKLLNKFGYTAICKECQTLLDSNIEIDQACKKILDTIQQNFTHNKILNETKQKILNESDEIGGINGINRSDIENDLKYFVEGVLKDNYFDNIEVVEVWLHGSRMRGDFKNTSDLDAVVFYKGHEKEDTIYNILVDESYNVMGINVDFNPIQIDNDNDIKEYKEISNKYDQEKLNEGLKEAAASFALSLALLIPGIASAQTIRYAIENNTSIKKVYNKENIFKQLLKDQKPNSQFGKFKFWQACNIAALTLFGEGRSEISNGGIDLICDSILNRTATGTPDLKRVADICIGKKEGYSFQYSFWNENKKALNVITNEINAIVPTSITNVIEKQAWEFCIQRSVEILTNNYTVTNTKINSYYVTDMKNPPDWADKLTNKQIKGKHTFGYLTSNDPKYTDMSTMISHDEKIDVSKLSYFVYTVKRGDNLWNLAKKFNTKVKILAKLNNIPTNKILKPGQKIKINTVSSNNQSDINIQTKQQVSTYIVKPDDTLTKISKNNNISVKKILELNPHIKNPNIITPGMKLNLN